MKKLTKQKSSMANIYFLSSNLPSPFSDSGHPLLGGARPPAPLTALNSPIVAPFLPNTSLIPPALARIPRPPSPSDPRYALQRRPHQHHRHFYHPSAPLFHLDCLECLDVIVTKTSVALPTPCSNLFHNSALFSSDHCRKFFSDQRPIS